VEKKVILVNEVIMEKKVILANEVIMGQLEIEVLLDHKECVGLQETVDLMVHLDLLEKKVYVVLLDLKVISAQQALLEQMNNILTVRSLYLLSAYISRHFMSGD
jgi:hypothetical protein